MQLKRKERVNTGIFSELLNDDGSVFCQTLEHAYPDPSLPGVFTPKVLPGVYICVRGSHQLHGMTAPFETFEITGVPGHAGILFHCGNVNADSEGCVLLGFKKLGDVEILESRKAFEAFMSLMTGVDSFQLTVV